MVKPIVVPSGTAKPISTIASAVREQPPKPIVVPPSSGVKPKAKPAVVPEPSDSESSSSSDDETEDEVDDKAN